MLFFGGLVVVALFSALLAPLFVDWTNFRQDFEREASRIMGRQVVVHGKVDARLLPFPSVTLNDVRVGSQEDGQPLVEVARFSMDAELAPFLSGEALIFDMRIEEPKARVKLFEDGTLDWARGRQSDIPAKTVVLENVTISGGEVEFVDEQTGRTRTVTGLDANIAARSLAGPWRVEGRAVLDGEAGAFQLSSGQLDDAGTLRMRARLVPDRLGFTADLEGDLKVVDFKPQYHGTFSVAEKPQEDGKPAPDHIRISGGFELSNERLRIPEYRLEAGDRADPYIVTGEATLDTGKVPEFLLIADGQQIDVSRIGNSGEAGKTERSPEISARRRLEALLSIAADIPIPQVPGRASLKLPALVVGDTTVRELTLDLRPDGDAWLVDRAEAQFPGRTALEAKGRLQLRGDRSFVGDLLIASNQPSGLATWLAGSVDPEIRSLKTAGFSAKVNLNDTLQRFEDLELAAGPAILKGRIERQSLADQPPGLSIELKGETVEVESLQALAGLVAGDASLDMVLSHAIALDLDANTFTALGETAHGVNAVLSLKDGTLRVERLDVASLAGAAISANGTLGGSLLNPAAGLRAQIRADAMRPILTLLSRHLPQHPVLDRIVRNGNYFDEADLTLSMALPGEEAGRAVANLSGAVNGGRLNARLSAPSALDLVSGEDFDLEMRVENQSTVVLAGQMGLDPLPFDAEPDGVAVLTIQQRPDEDAEIVSSFTAGATSVTAEGAIALGATDFGNGTLKLAVESGDIEPYLLMNGIVLPQTGAGLAVTAAADLAVTTDTLSLADIRASAGGNTISGELQLERGVQSPKGKGKLSLGTLDLAWLAETVLGAVDDPVDGGLNGETLGRPLLENADLALQIEAERFWPGLYGAIDGFSSALTWRGGDFSLDAMKGDWLGGRLDGRLKIANAEENGLFEARGELVGADLGRIVWDGANGPVAEGKADVTLALDASGKSLRAMAEAASGSGEVLLKDIAVNGIQTGGFGSILAAADRIEGDITEANVIDSVRAAVTGGTTRLGEVRIPFGIASGTVRAQTITAKDTNARFSGDIEIGLPQQTLAARLDMRLLAGDDALTGAEPEVEFSWSGPLAAPEMAFDAQGMTNYLSLRRFETERRRVEALQANVLEKQRLRREAALYRARAEERQALAEASRVQREEEERRRREVRSSVEKARQERDAAEAVERQRRAVLEEQRKLRQAEAEARRLAQQRAAEEAAQRRAEQAERRLPVIPGEGVERGELPPVGDGQPLNFDSLPGVN
jgi:uncharacterized protein involved in outer membrane biogenesis